jgi:signal transduction histidine kinase
MPPLYGLLFVAAGAALGTLGAYVADQHRRTAYQHAHAAQRASRAKSEFLSTVSHELRTPLNVIIGYTTLLLDDALDAGAGRDALRRIHHESLQLLDLIQAMLDLNKVEAGGAQVTVEDFRLGDLIESLRGGLPAGWCKNGVQLNWVTPTPDARLHTDRAKLQMIVRNLVHNALKFTEQGWVRVQLALESAAMVLTVTDTGIGIDPKDQPVIFEMFRQGDGSDRRRFGGTGLGLHIVQRFVEQLGGTITVHSVPGMGSRFSVTLPFDRTGKAAARAA